MNPNFRPGDNAGEGSSTGAFRYVPNADPTEDTADTSGRKKRSRKGRHYKRPRGAPGLDSAAIQPVAAQSTPPNPTRWTEDWALTNLTAFLLSLCPAPQPGTSAPYKKLQFSSEGQVTVGRMKATGHLFVVKDVRRHTMPNEARILLEELRKHQNIIVVRGVVQMGIGQQRIVMEYCAGGDLFEHLRHWRNTLRAGGPREMFVLHTIIGVADALAYLHHGLRFDDQGMCTIDRQHTSIIHGDLKPENILLRWRPGNLHGMPDLVLADFGNARRADGLSVNPYILGLGTVVYSSPELRDLVAGPQSLSMHEYKVRVAATITRASDIYSFGHILYMLLSKSPRPYTIGAMPEVMPLSPEYRTPGLWALAQGCLQILPRDRPTASDGRGGMMTSLVGGLRRAREQMVTSYAQLPPSQWAHPNPNAGT